MKSTVEEILVEIILIDEFDNISFYQNTAINPDRDIILFQVPMRANLHNTLLLNIA